MLLIAGQATAMDGWGPAAEALAEHFRVFRFDHRGIGASSNGDADRYTTRLLAADAAAVLKAARADSAHVYGHSMGGRIALILHGTDDALTPLTNAPQLHQHIRRSTLVRVPGAGHGLHLDHPETIRWIQQFIAAKAPR